MPSIVPLHQQLYHAAQVRDFDRLAIEQHALPGIVLMKRAAQAMWHVAQARWPTARHYVVLCGGGNNGGDGFLFAALAVSRNSQVTVIHTRTADQLRGDAERAWRALQASQSQSSGEVHFVLASEQNAAVEVIGEADLVVDCLLGTGLNQSVRPLEKALIQSINRSTVPVLAADLPSGLNSDSGAEMGVAVQADCTVSFVALKLGLFTASGPQCCGDLVFTNLGIPAAVFRTSLPAACLLDLRELQTLTPTRQANAHKGRHGHTLVIGGDTGMGGAIILAARAALYSGSGLVSVATRAQHVGPCLSQQAELMVHAVRHSEDLQPLLTRCTSVVIGPGLGQSSWSRGLLHAVLRAPFSGPMVLDADALNLVAAENWQSLLIGKQVLTTPHPGEAARLLACTNAEVQADRLGSVRALQQQLGGHSLLKGAGTLLCDDQGEVTLCGYGNAGMAAGGTGDVLSGVIGALLAQGLGSAQALQLGACLHSAAADQLREQTGTTVGMTASELIPVIRRFLNPPCDLPGPRVAVFDQERR